MIASEARDGLDWTPYFSHIACSGRLIRIAVPACRFSWTLEQSIKLKAQLSSAEEVVIMYDSTPKHDNIFWENIDVWNGVSVNQNLLRCLP